VPAEEPIMSFISYISGPSIWIYFTIIASLLFVVVALLDWLWQYRSLKTMRGPKGYPFIGIGLSLPRKAAKVLRVWAQQYGEVYKIRVGWYNWVVVNSPQAVKEIFDKQVGIYFLQINNNVESSAK
jgi:hypothetical protein